MEWLAQIAVGLGSAAAGFFGGFFLLRGKRVEAETAETQVEASATDAFLRGQQAFQAHVDGIVEKRVDAAVEDLRARLTDVEEKLEAVTRESHEMNDAYRTFTTRLWVWNVRGRGEPIPELPEGVLRRLGLIHLSGLGELEDTQPVRPAPDSPENET